MPEMYMYMRSIFTLSLRQFEEKQLKGQQIRAQKRLEFADLQSRLQNQLEFERRKDPTGLSYSIVGSIPGHILLINLLYLAVVQRSPIPLHAGLNVPRFNSIASTVHEGIYRMI